MLYSFSGGVFLRMEYFLDSFLLASVAGIWFDWCSVLFCIKYCLSKAWCSLLDSFSTHQSWDFRKLQIAFLTERMFWKEQVSRISESLDLAGFQHHRAPNLFLVAATFPWEWSTSEKRAVSFLQTWLSCSTRALFIYMVPYMGVADLDIFWGYGQIKAPKSLRAEKIESVRRCCAYAKLFAFPNIILVCMHFKLCAVSHTLFP